MYVTRKNCSLCFLYFIAVIILLCCQVASGQISQRLYTQLPPDLIPKERQHTTDAEYRAIISQADRFASIKDTATVQELDHIAASLEQKSPYISRKEKVVTLTHIAQYLYIFRHKGTQEGLPYDQQIIQLGNNDPTLYKQLSSANIRIANYEDDNGNYETAITRCLAALDQAKKINDSSNVRAAYATISSTYVQLGLYEQALTYQKPSFNYITQKEKDNGLADVFTIDGYGYLSEIYLGWYDTEHLPGLADSAWAYIHKIQCRGVHAAWWKELYAYSMGQYYFTMKDYTTALKYIDTSLALEDYYRDAHLIKTLLRGICLLKTGKIEAGKKELLNNQLINADINLSVVAYRALYEYAKKEGSPVEALHYYELQHQYEDSAAILRQRGEVFETTRKYDIKGKQNEINMLALRNAAQQKERNAIIAASIASGLLLLTIIALLYTLGKKRQLLALHMKQELDYEKGRIETFLYEQDTKIKAAEQKAVMSQRRKISRDLHDGLSSALAALRYYINDLKQNPRNKNEQQLLQDVEQEVSTIYQQTREYMQHLYEGNETPEVDLCNFLTSLEKQFSNTKGFHIQLAIDLQEISRKLNPRQQTELYYIIKETITNTMKHAKATLISISIKLNQYTCVFRIGDNGQGIAATNSKGLGMESIASRVQALNGNVRVMPDMPGTWIDGSFPL